MKKLRKKTPLGRNLLGGRGGQSPPAALPPHAPRLLRHCWSYNLSAPETHFNYFYLIFQNLSDIITKQQRGKYYSALKSGKYSRICKTPDSLNNEKEKQTERLQTLSTIVDRITAEYPEMQTAFRGISLSMGGLEQLTERSARSEVDLA